MTEDFIQSDELDEILKKIRYKGIRQKRGKNRIMFRHWATNHQGNLSGLHATSNSRNGYGILDISSRDSLPYPTQDGLDVRPVTIERGTRNEITPLVGEYGGTISDNPFIMTSNNMTSYVRAVNDYTISVHEMYVSEFNATPHTSSIISIKDAPYGEIPSLRTAINEFLAANKLDEVKSGDISFYDDEEEADSYSVYKQNVSLFSDKTIHVGIEILGTTKLISVTIISNDSAFTKKLTAHLLETKEKYKTATEERKDKTFYTISSSQRGFELEDLNIKAEHIDGIILDNYNDDFVEAHDVVMNSIDSDKKGLILLHGIPGSGKTSYIKHLITGESKRKIVYIPTHLTSAISSPNFISFVKSELSNSVLVIEDAEQVLLSRENAESYKEAVSNILNMTDGILADALNILIICTFNTDMENIDKALLRKGRLLLSYKFTELNKTKTDALCQKLYGKSVGKALPLSDIYGLEYELITPKEKPSIKMGFAP